MRQSEKNYALITGASSGIGREFAIQLGRMGYSLILVARRQERLENLQQCFRKRGIACDIVVADLSIEKECYKLMKFVKDKRIDVFINNAGYGDCGFFLKTDLKKELGMIDLNVRSMHLLMKLVLQKMEKCGYGNLLNVASSAGLFPGGPYMATYYASKSYVASLTQAVAWEMKQRGSNIYVGCLCPGPVETEFNQIANAKFSLNEISAQKCVAYAIKKMMQKQIVIVPTLTLQLAVLGSRFISRSFNMRMVGYQQQKKLGKE